MNAKLLEALSIGTMTYFLWSKAKYDVTSGCLSVGLVGFGFNLFFSKAILSTHLEMILVFHSVYIYMLHICYIYECICIQRKTFVKLLASAFINLFA